MTMNVRERREAYPAQTRISTRQSGGRTANTRSERRDACVRTYARRQGIRESRRSANVTRRTSCPGLRHRRGWGSSLRRVCGGSAKASCERCVRVSWVRRYVRTLSSVHAQVFCGVQFWQRIHRHERSKQRARGGRRHSSSPIRVPVDVALTSVLLWCYAMRSRVTAPSLPSPSSCRRWRVAVRCLTCPDSSSCKHRRRPSQSRKETRASSTSSPVASRIT